MNKNGVEEQLKAIFTNINDWLKFAETKNAAIIAADAAASFGALSVLAGKSENLKMWFFLYLHSFIFFLMCSALTALVSVIPKSVILLSIPKEEPDSENDNLLFYGHIAKYKPIDYLIALQNRFGKANIKPTGLELNYAQQIVINSQIAAGKYDFFRYAVWLSVTAIITPIGWVILFVIANKKYEKWLVWWKEYRKAETDAIKSEDDQR